MQIGIDASRAVTQQRTGTEAYALQMIRHLVPLAHQKGHTVQLYFNQPPARPLTDTPHHAIIMPFARLWTHIRLAAALHRNPPDIFFTPAHVIPLSYHGRAVATIHDLGYERFPAAHTRQQVAYLKWSTRHNATRSHTILADSHATKNDLYALYGIQSDKIKVVYPALAPQVAQKPETTIKTNMPYFLYIGTLQPRKNLVRLIAAFEQIAAMLPHQLILAGKKGWQSDAIVEAAAHSPFRDRIRLLGFVSDERKATLLQHATALVFPSLYEGFGFPVLEAQRAGTAVLTANNSSLPEVAGDAALMVNAHDQDAIAGGMLQLALNGRLREHLITRGRKNIERFSWQQSAAHTLTLLEEAAQ